ncbi:hypothetical protein FRB96_008661 [Tulasnella sp. 330]|nr:hypothetical protein FRB96_008661 [Tulasnella sp. 330]
MNTDSMELDNGAIIEPATVHGSTSVAAQIEQKPLPEHTKSWNLPRLCRAPFPPPETLEGRIDPDSLFYVPNEDGSDGRFVVPAQCTYCLVTRKRFCDRAYPVCTTCSQYNLTCVPSREGYMDLPPRQGPGSRSGRPGASGSLAASKAKRPTAARSIVTLSQPQKRPAKAKVLKGKVGKPVKKAMGSITPGSATSLIAGSQPDLTLGASDSLTSGLSDSALSDQPLASLSEVPVPAAILSKKEKPPKWDITKRSWEKPPVPRKAVMLTVPPMSKPEPDRYEVWGATMYELRQAMPILEKFEHGFQISKSGLVEVLQLDGSSSQDGSWADGVLKITLSVHYKLNNFIFRGDNPDYPPLPASSELESVMLSYRLGLPFCLVIGNGYAGFPFTLGVPYAVLGWYNFIEAEEVQSSIGTRATGTPETTAMISTTIKIAPADISKSKFALTPQGMKKIEASLHISENGDEDDNMEISDEDNGHPAERTPISPTRDSSIDGSPIIQVPELVVDTTSTPPRAPKSVNPPFSLPDPMAHPSSSSFSVHKRWFQLENFGQLRPPTKKNFAVKGVAPKTTVKEVRRGSSTGVSTYRSGASLGAAVTSMFLRPEKHRPAESSGSLAATSPSGTDTPMASTTEEIQPQVSAPQAPIATETPSSLSQQPSVEANPEIEKPSTEPRDDQERPIDVDADADEPRLAFPNNPHPTRLCGPEELNFPELCPKEPLQVTQVQAISNMFCGFVCTKCKKANAREHWATLQCTYCKIEKPAAHPTWNLKALMLNPWSPGERDDSDQSREMVVRKDTWTDGVKIMAYSSDTTECKLRIDHVISTNSNRIHELDGVLEGSKDITGLSRSWIYPKASSKTSVSEPELANYFLQVVGEGTIDNHPTLSFNELERRNLKASITITEYSAQCASRTHLAREAEPWDQQLLSLGSGASPMYEDRLDNDVHSDTAGVRICFMVVGSDCVLRVGSLTKKIQHKTTKAAEPIEQVKYFETDEEELSEKEELKADVGEADARPAKTMKMTAIDDSYEPHKSAAKGKGARLVGKLAGLMMMPIDIFADTSTYGAI